MTLCRDRAGKQHSLDAHCRPSAVLGTVPHLIITATLPGKRYSKRKIHSCEFLFTLTRLSVSLTTPDVWVFYTSSNFEVLAGCPTI